MLDRLPPSVRPRIETVKKQFPDLGGVEVVEVTTVWARRAAELLAGLEDDRLRVLFRDLFEERAAICEHDAGLPMVQAEQMAYQELLAMVENLNKDVRQSCNFARTCYDAAREQTNQQVGTDPEKRNETKPDAQG